MLNATVNDADRQRGFTEVELTMRDGTRQAFRVHALPRADYQHAATLASGSVQLIYLVARALRETPFFVVSKLSEDGWLAVSIALAGLATSNAEADALADRAARSALNRASLAAGEDYHA